MNLRHAQLCSTMDKPAAARRLAHSRITVRPLVSRSMQVRRVKHRRIQGRRILNRRPADPRFMVHRGTVCLRHIHTRYPHLHAIHRRGGSCSRIESLRHRRRRSRAAHRVAIRSTIQTTRSSACRTTGAQIGGWK